MGWRKRAESKTLFTIPGATTSDWAAYRASKGLKPEWTMVDKNAWLIVVWLTAENSWKNSGVEVWEW